MSSIFKAKKTKCVLRLCELRLHKDWNLLISFCLSAVSRLDIGLSIAQITAKEFNTIEHIIENLQAQNKHLFDVNKIPLNHNYLNII